MNRLNFKDIKPEILKGTRDGSNWYSGKGQDAFIKKIFDTIGTTNKFCIEFGGGDGYNASNTLYLTYHGWKRLMFDRNHNNPSINLFQEVLTAENICEIFEKYNTPVDLDFISIDIDGNDYWLLQSILTKFSPRAIMVEINSRFDLYDKKVIKYDPSWRWDGRGWYGASPYLFKLLGERRGYTVVGTYKDEAFLVRDDCLHPDDKRILWEDIYTPNWEIYEGTSPTIDETQWIEINE